MGPLARLGGMIADEELYQGAEFTEAELRRLVFLRWLYRAGRLTEWP